MSFLRIEDIRHKSYLNRLLVEIIDNQYLSQHLAFKGGTCALMLGFLDRFSVDLDFDLFEKDLIPLLRNEFHKIFNLLGLTVTKENPEILFFQVRYNQENAHERNLIKISAHDLPVKANEYTVSYFKEIDRLMKTQTMETMFANKLVALTDRYKKHKTVAGRDIYDIHHFFLQGYGYTANVIKERTQLSQKAYFVELVEFMKKHVTQTIINEDLNTLLPPDKFQQIRKILIPETLHFLQDEVQHAMHLQ